MSRFHFLALILSSCFLFHGCTSEPQSDIRGDWQYEMITPEGDVYDQGSITFQGQPASGQYLQVNIYEVEYSGDYMVDGEKVKLTGYENWTGVMESENLISGTWKHDDGTNGTFTASRK